jgi:hypothetical protein
VSDAGVSQEQPGRALDVSGDTYVPSFITIIDVTQPGGGAAEFVVSNEASGKHFMANEATANFITALRDHGSVAHALALSRLDASRAGALVKQLIDTGFLVRYGATDATASTAAAPLESKLISARWDMLDIGRVVRRLNWVGRTLYSRAGYVLWGLGLCVMLFQLATNVDKIRLTMAQALTASWTQWVIFAVLYLGLKVAHEMGHAMAFRQMSQQEGLEEGPIRVGIAIFAFAPFPFTDVTSAWRLKSRWRRVMIGLGGIYFETWVMILLTLFWAQTQTGLLQTVILQVTIIAGAMTLLFNLNPAVKLDGYFVMTDYFRAPNLAGRAGQAARSVAARTLGADLPKPRTHEMVYWVISYAYRWTIFAGIFWIIYQFDARLAPVALGIVVMTLLVRPLINTLRFARKSGVRVVKAATTVAVLVMGAALLFVPFDRFVSAQGAIMLYDTRYIEASEAGLLSVEPTGLTLRNAELLQQAEETALQQLKLENLLRASYASAEGQAGLAAELDSYREIGAQMRMRLDELTVEHSGNGDAIWSIREAQWREGSWVDPALGQILGAVSVPTAAFITVQLPQNLLTSDMAFGPGTQVEARAKRYADCIIDTRVDTRQMSAIAQDDIVLVRTLVDMNALSCPQALQHGAPVIARFAAGRASLADRFWLYAERTLQDRLLLNEK